MSNEIKNYCGDIEINTMIGSFSNENFLFKNMQSSKEYQLDNWVGSKVVIGQRIKIFVVKLKFAGIKIYGGFENLSDINLEKFKRGDLFDCALKKWKDFKW